MQIGDLRSGHLLVFRRNNPIDAANVGADRFWQSRVGAASDTCNLVTAPSRDSPPRGSFAAHTANPLEGR
jgi:hypothetical protein